MPNKNYIRGRKFEYEVMEDHYKNGALEVYRTAGSHGSYDVIAVYSERIEMIQCKTKLTHNEALKGTTVKSEERQWNIRPLIGYKLTKYIRRTK